MASTYSAPGVGGPAVAIGAGLGGLADGIVLHQLLGWHHLLSARPEFGMRGNEVADGVFHAASWLVVLIGVLWLYARLRVPPVAAAWPRLAVGPRPWRSLVGSMLVGWGVFNVVEGVLDHQVLGLHHVRSGHGQLVWDLAFLAVGAAMFVAGLAVSRSHRRLTPDTAPAD